jgi:hypothetical protein
MATLMLAFSLNALAQNFDPTPSSAQEKLEVFLKRFGTFDKISLNDATKKTFLAEPGKDYFIGFAFEAKDESVRRMMIAQLGEKGEKVKLHYPKASRAVNDGKTQFFAIEFTAPTDVSGSSITYRVDASPTANVYLYRITRGVKRDTPVLNR